ncbi:unnamed protein product [Rhizoctonia solani]|uniref:Uncharacterized protein n=1 Tax=Rhizoctonia solani TaxID=456999 RepID=A0A8H3C3H9_9AGAM|nr:unnamed protein product [Rhizoctonia solani]
MSTYLNSTLQQLVIPQENTLYYTLLGIFGATSALALLKATNSNPKSNVSTLAGPTASSTVWGNTPELYNPETNLDFQDQLRSAYGSACLLKGPFGAKDLWVSDPRAMQEILIKGHDEFREPAWLTTWLKLVFGPAVITVTGHQHKVQRKVLYRHAQVLAHRPCCTETFRRFSIRFSLQVICEITPTVTTIAHKLVEMITSDVQANGESNGIIDIHKWVHLISLEIISQAGMSVSIQIKNILKILYIGMGHSFGVLEGNVPGYLHASRDMFALMTEMWYLQPFIAFLSKIGPAFFRRAVVETIPHRPVQKMKNVVDTMHKTAVEIIKKKREALEIGTLDSEVAAGQDIMTALLRQNLVVAPQDQMTDEEVLAQVNGLVFAGHDTTSSALSRTIDLLAKHQDVQTKLRDEIRQAYHSKGNNLDYDQLNSLAYLDAVCRESLRLHSPASSIARVATKDWTLPLQYPSMTRDGKSVVTHINVTKGTNIYLSIQAANMDERTWGEDAGEFRPDRWLQPLPESVTNARIPGLYSSTMTFSGGPRSCPGMKFSQLEMKLILSTLVSSFKFDPTQDAIKWMDDGIVKPHIQRADGSISEEPMMPVKVTVLGDIE